jgi:protein phosphatase
MRVRIVQSEDPSPEAVSPETFGAARDTFEVAARTHVGRTRTNNEDNFTVVPELALFVLSDGMGGEAAGELASKIAVEEILRHMKEVERNESGSTPPLGDPNAQFSELTNQLAAAVRRSNRVIWEAAQQHASQRGMGATVVAALLRAPVLSIAHVGDSRIYLHRAGELQQLTEDHSLVMEQVRRGLITKEEAERSEMQNILVRALGAEEAVAAEMDEVFVMPGDQVLLCSDGLTRMVEDSAIAKVIAESAAPQQACDRLVEMANENGGEDNITVVLVRVREAPPKGFWSWLKSLFS